jgi:hypothetical protein
MRSWESVRMFSYRRVDSQDRAAFRELIEESARRPNSELDWLHQLSPWEMVFRRLIHRDTLSS